jgi:hypothetical protein
MTDPEAPTQELPPVPKRPAKPRIRKPGPLGVTAGSFGLFFMIAALLAFQMRRGADPALGAPKPQVAAAPAAPRQILVRRVIVTRIVEHRTGRVRSAPQRSTSSPAAPSRPAAPAPAPAPLTTRSS